jgi:hypothetical protein
LQISGFLTDPDSGKHQNQIRDRSSNNCPKGNA